MSLISGSNVSSRHWYAQHGELLIQVVSAIQHHYSQEAVSA